MANKFGIFQSSTKSCIFYKEDQDGNQSTFNIFKTPTGEDREKIVAFIDNENMNQENWSREEITDPKEVIDAFGGWAADAPIVFELEAHKSLSHCLSRMVKED